MNNSQNLDKDAIFADTIWLLTQLIWSRGLTKRTPNENFKFKFLGGWSPLIVHVYKDGKSWGGIEKYIGSPELWEYGSFKFRQMNPETKYFIEWLSSLKLKLKVPLDNEEHDRIKIHLLSYIDLRNSGDLTRQDVQCGYLKK